jgi:hypothetical protein
MGWLDALFSPHGPQGVIPRLGLLADRLRAPNSPGILGGYVPLGGGPEYRKMDLVNQQQMQADEWAQQNPKQAMVYGLLSGGQPGGAATLFHGSPHRFSKFDLSKVGTGEGAQAYGHGLYFAENPAVARSYASPEATYQRVTGGLSPKQEFAHDLFSQGRDSDSVWRAMVQKYGRQAAETAEFQDAYDAAMKMNRAGNLYKTDVPDPAIAKMLDWDKPLSQQSEHVKAALQQLPNAEVQQAFARDWTAHKLIKSLEQSLGSERQVPGSLPGVTERYGGPQAVSELLRGIGIPGTRYLDQGSRGAGTGTRNYVVFDDRLPTIMSRE